MSEILTREQLTHALTGWQDGFIGPEEILAHDAALRAALAAAERERDEARAERDEADGKFQEMDKLATRWMRRVAVAEEKANDLQRKHGDKLLDLGAAERRAEYVAAQLFAAEAEMDRMRGVITEWVPALREACVRVVVPEKTNPWMWLALLGEARDAADALDAALAPAPRPATPDGGRE